MRSPPPFAPPRLLRGRHLQTVLASAPPRRVLLRRRTRAAWSPSQALVLDAGAGVRLSAVHTPQVTCPRSRGLLVFLHGWEGSAASTYLLESGAAALAAGWDVLRLNLRDHGGSEALNRGLFHSCRLQEMVGALAAVARRWQPAELRLAGFSLGGNFALRMARAAPAAGITLAAVLAVCPVVEPAASMAAIEASPRLYLPYFMRQWRAALVRKQQAFPEAELFTAAELRLGLRELTRLLVERHTDYPSLDAYLAGYSLGGTRLDGLALPARVLASRDDPVIPFADLTALARLPELQLDAVSHGGHCGFVRNARLEGWVGSYLRAWLDARPPYCGRA